MSKAFIINDKAITVSLIVSMAENRVIGKDNKLLWHIPEDLKYFKTTTMGKPIIMGRKTYESLPGGMLPGRPHIVITRNPPEDNADLPPDLHYATSLDEAIDVAHNIVRETDGDEICVIGGAQIYTEALKAKAVHKMYITLIHRDYVGDTYFPVIDMRDWRLVKEARREGDPNFTFQTYLRV